MNSPLVWTIVVAAVLAAGAGVWWWRKRRGDDHRLVSLVALLREPQHLEPRMVANAARKAWQADLGDGESEGPDGFVAGMAISNIVQYGERMIMVNCFPKPYVDDPEAAGRGMTDLRLQHVFSQHTAWLSCDAMGVGRDTPDAEVAEWYRLLGPLLAELIDDNCLAIYVPDRDHLHEYNPEIENCLRADDPLEALAGERNAPVIEIGDDDPRMQAAVAEAKQRWPEFLAAFEARRGQNFSVKAPITRQDKTEFIWVEVGSVENAVIYGTLANDPIDLGGLKLGSRVRVPLGEINDWGYLDDREELIGAFTMKVLQQAAQERKG
jgi:uncharacterized protein YegJ (DUF2314 family)